MKVPLHDALLEAWNETLARRRDEPAIIDPQRRSCLSFAGIEELSLHYEDAHAHLASFNRGDVVAIQIGNHPHWPALLLACLRRKIIVLPLEQTMSELERAAALRISRAAGLITDPDVPSQRLIPGSATDWGESVPVLLKLTSGTTAAPRAIRFRSEQLLADAAQICETMGITERDLNFGIVPLSHSYGFSNLITPLLARGVSLALSRDRMPRAVLGDLARSEATIFPGMPVFYQAVAEMGDVPALPKLRLCISAGAPLTRTVARMFHEKFGQSIHSFYGASECGGICYDRSATNEVEGFVGPPIRGVELQRLEENVAAGQIRVRSAAIGDGYFPEPDPDKLGHGFFVPDDLVAMSDAGVRIVGRSSDVINVAGKKVNPAEIEAHLLSSASVRQAIVFGRASALRNQEVAACVVAREETDEATLLEFCRAHLSAWQVPKRIFLVDALPTNERGKISRRELAAHFSE